MTDKKKEKSLWDSLPLLKCNLCGTTFKGGHLCDYAVLKEQNASFREALEFYVDEESYKVNVTEQWQPVRPIDKDGGEKARRVLRGEST